MSSECCKELNQLAERFTDESKDDINSNTTVFEYAKAVNSILRQCTCLLQNPALIMPVKRLLCAFYKSFADFVLQSSQTCENEVELVIQAVCKTFQINFPVYQAYESVKNNFEVPEEEKNAVKKYCEVSENACDLLYENVTQFFEVGCVRAITDCFSRKPPIPLSLASSLICIIAQLRSLLHDEATAQFIKPLSSHVTRYLCNTPEEELRQISARSTAELMINSVKVQDNSQLTHDEDLLNISFKYFMSSTLAVRLAGLNLITNQIHTLHELSQNPTYRSNVDSLCSQMADWLNENKMIEHLFGPNYHIELIKQSQFLLNFLAQERQLQHKHLDCLWSAAQLKHMSRYVLELLIMLAKVMDLVSVQYLLTLIAGMQPSAHTKQTLMLTSLLTRAVWTSGLTTEPNSGASTADKSPVKVTPQKLSFSSRAQFKHIAVSPIQSLSSEASSDEEIANLHANKQSISLKLSEELRESQFTSPLLQLSPTTAEDIDLLSSQETVDIQKLEEEEEEEERADDAISCTNTNGSLTDREHELDEDLEDENLSLSSTADTPVKITSCNDVIDFNVDELCEPGNTLLWDLVLEPNSQNLVEGLLDEALKLLSQLVCYTGDKKVRTVFIKGCLNNIKNNRSVMVSFKLLPKIISAFPYTSKHSAHLLHWAVNELHLMDVFFENLSVLVADIVEHDPRHVEVIQSRLDFLTALFSNDISPDHFRLSLAQVDRLWKCLITDVPDAYHHLLLSWLLKQSNGDDALHSLGLDSFKHIFVKKLTELNAEKITLTGLSLFQKLFGLTRLSNASPFPKGEKTDTEEFILGARQLWDIALKAERLHVSNEAMNILNHLYLTGGENSVHKEEEFIQKCMQVLRDSVNNISQNCLQSLKMIQQVLKILNNHLLTYSKRMAYHVELWNLRGENVSSHQNIKKYTSKDVPLKLMCQPTGVIEKMTFKMMSCDLLATFRARVTHWCVGVQARKKPNDTSTELKPPFRLISHGHELTHEFDTKTLAEIGLRENQLVYVSIMNLRKENAMGPLSLQPPPAFDSVPMVQMLKQENFTQLFHLLDVLFKLLSTQSYEELRGHFTTEESALNDSLDRSFDNPHELIGQLPAEHLLNNTWDLILMLPTSPELKARYRNLDFTEPWSDVLSLEKRFSLLYALQILDALTLPIVKSSVDSNDSSGDSDSSISDNDKTASETNLTREWIMRLFEKGLIAQLLRLLLNIAVEQDEWLINCVAYIVKLLTRIGLADNNNSAGVVRVRKSHVFRARYRSSDTDNVVVINEFSQNLLNLVSSELFEKLISLLHSISMKSCETYTNYNQDVRASVVYHCLSFLVCWCTCDDVLRQRFIQHEKFSQLLLQLVYYSPQKSVRTEGSRGIYKLCVCGSQAALNDVLRILLVKLKQLVADNIAENKTDVISYKDYFWLLCRLVNKYVCLDADDTSIRTALIQVTTFIQNAPTHLTEVDNFLVGLLQTCAALIQHDAAFKSLPEGAQLMQTMFDKALFNLPQESDVMRPLCQTKQSRLAAYELLLQLVSGCREMHLQLLSLFLRHHQLTPHCYYGWNYWPFEQERAAVGYVGLINLGATCYMASCMQQLFMIPKARCAILQPQPTDADSKHPAIFKEVQKMFAFLHGSIRKAYNPKSFCRTYSMDKLPLNTAEQKDMTEFFTDFVSKLEEMGPELKKMMRELFCGVITNNVISLDCNHVSKTEEEFYSVRCTVADMKNLYESLDEVTVKDVLEGDNKYTCSQCNDKVRAEKRACFKTLPKVVCFNTMRYTFNMLTMMKEKVNTHFSFPMRLNMAAYTEDYLLNDRHDSAEPEGHWYNLAGVVVHTGTADGGHYYSFIRDRTSRAVNKWYLFNDAEVKTFDPQQIAAECFGGEMTTKTFDTMTEKYMDFSFEKTHSAYMLFYEHADMDRELRDTRNITLPPDLRATIAEDNRQFLQDKLVFDQNYFTFLWQFCHGVPKTFAGESDDSTVFHVTKLAVSFVLETLVHSQEKHNIKGWVELLVMGFDRSQAACEWFLDSMSHDDWWLVQMFIKCPTQNLRQMFSQLCLIAIKNMRPTQVEIYGSNTESSDDEGNSTPISRFIKTLLSLFEDNLRGYCKNLPELFNFLHQFLSLGHEECVLLLKMDAISTFVSFYNCIKISETESCCGPSVQPDDEDLEGEDMIMFPDDHERFFPSALEKMIAGIALLLEAARDGPELHLSETDAQCFLTKKENSFLHQITMDGVNIRQTANIIFYLSCYNHQVGEQIVDCLMSAAQRLGMEQAQNFFKLFSMLSEVGENGLPGLPSFKDIILPHIWKTAEQAPALTLDWLSNHVARNKQIHKFVYENMDIWVEKYLICDTSPRIRGGASYLLASLVPNVNFPQSFRGRLFFSPQKQIKISEDAKIVVKKIYKYLLDMLPTLKAYCDKSQLGTTRLINYFTLLAYCCISNEEKTMFTPYCDALWALYHPTMSEPDVSVHFSKQALLTFWYHVCEGCEENIKFISDTPDVATNIAYNYILSNDDQDVIAYNNVTLPMYYGLLRLACQHSATFCRQLSQHSNMAWAFEHIMPRSNHYSQVTEELLNLMKLFAGSNYTQPDDLECAGKFRKKTIELMCNAISDGHYACKTLVRIIRVLVQNEEECLHAVTNNALIGLGEAFTSLHVIHLDSSNSNVIADVLETTNLLHNIFTCCQPHLSKIDALYKAVHTWEDRDDVMVKALRMLNSYVPAEIRKACLDLLLEMLQVYPEEAIAQLAPIVRQSHLSIRMTSHENIVSGPYFPKPASSGKRKSSSAKPDLNMTLHPQLLDSTSQSDCSDYMRELGEYYEQYHSFVDKLCRYALNADKVPNIIIEISCLLAVEVLPLKFQFFPKLWREVFDKASENPKYRTCIQSLFINDSFIEFLDTLFTEERILFDDQIYYSFVCVFLPKVHCKVLSDHPRQTVLNTIIASIVADVSTIATTTREEFEKASPKLHGDIRALSLLMSVSAPEVIKISTLLEDCLKVILERHTKYKDEKSEQEEKASVAETPSEKEEEAPLTKKRKISDDDVSDDRPGDSTAGASTSGYVTPPQTRSRENEASSSKQNTNMLSKQKMNVCDQLKKATQFLLGLLSRLKEKSAGVDT